MEIELHNKLEVFIGEKKVCFYNTMLKSVAEKLKNLSSYNKYLAIGNGNKIHLNNDYHLNNHISTFEFKTDFLNDEIGDDENTPFIKNTILIDDETLDGKYITEAGITDSSFENPIIYNYFSLTNDDFPNGILKEEGKPILISVSIFLNISTNGQGLFTLGHNKFISFLLGNGLENKIFACRGNNLIDNSKCIYREQPISNEKFECEFSIDENDEILTLNFVADLGVGETSEIVLLIGDNPFARINVQDFKSNINIKSNYTPKTNYVIDMGENVKEVVSVKNLSSQEFENDIFTSKYACRFGDKVSLPFNNVFTINTPRFLSKDGNIIFFVLDDSLFAYKNEEYQFKQIKTNGRKFQNIINISSFDNFVFIITKTEPFIYAFEIIKNELFELSFNFSALDDKAILSSISKADIVLAKNDEFMFAIIEKETNFGYVLYLNFDIETKTFFYSSIVASENSFDYLLAMQKNNFSDALILMLKADEDDLQTKIVKIYPDKTLDDVYTTLSIDYTKNTREIYVKNRAVIVEKTTSPHLWVYFYPQIYRYTLSLFGDELDDYISTDLHYLIQKTQDYDFKIYNLVGYDSPTEFLVGFPEDIEKFRILGFEFVGDILLIFSDDSSNPISAYSLFENSMLIENVSTNSDNYEIEYEKYNLIGQNNEGVIVKFTIDINV